VSFKSAKYLTWDDGITDCVVVFSRHLSHADIANKLQIAPLSAGFVDFIFDQNTSKIIADAYGESVSLKLKSTNDDHKLIQKAINLN
jgi:hypothetical protein